MKFQMTHDVLTDLVELSSPVIAIAIADRPPAGVKRVARSGRADCGYCRVGQRLVAGVDALRTRPDTAGNDRPDRALGAGVLLVMKRQPLILVGLVIVLTTGGLPAAAQSTDTDKAAPVEVTPYASLGSYPSPRVGAAVAFRLTPTLSVESEVGYCRDMTGRLSATASLLYDLPRIGRFRPYLAAGAGLEEYATALRLPDGALAAQPRKAFAINAGGGLKVPVDANWGIRTDARWFNGLGRDAGEHWRLYNGVTLATAGR
jgi:hypothetical protein